MSLWREMTNKTYVFGDQMSPWRQMFCLAKKGGLRQVDDDVAETHWQRNVLSP